MTNKTQTTKPADAKTTGQVSSREQEREAARHGAEQASGYRDAPPDYYQLSYLKRSDEGALWEKHTEYFPTHEDSTTRALALSTSGAACVRTLPRYWMV